MQFEYNHKVGTDYVTVKFIGNYLSIDYRVRDKLNRFFQRIGGQVTEGGNWRFPLFVGSMIIAQVIHNTCFVCGGLMGDTWASDNVNSIHIRKCTACGHSHT